MRVILDSTNNIVKVHGVECRKWVGNSSGGLQVSCYIAVVAVDIGIEDITEISRSLLNIPEPSDEGRPGPG